jgi:hypothetical protein
MGGSSGGNSNHEEGVVAEVGVGVSSSKDLGSGTGSGMGLRLCRGGSGEWCQTTIITTKTLTGAQ